MNENMKFIEIEDSEGIRKFAIKKFNAKTGIKMTKLFSAKILPVFSQVIPAFSALTKMEMESEKENIQSVLMEKVMENPQNFLSLESVSKAIDTISDDDLDKVIDTSLKHCYEILPAGQVKILNDNGAYGVLNVEDDAILVMRLTAEAILWSIGGFFNGSRLISILAPLAASSPFTPLT